MARRGRVAEHLELKRNVWFAKLAIPTALRPAFGGQSYFVQTTRTTDRVQARLVAAVLVANHCCPVR